MKLLNLLALVATLASAVVLYFAAVPVSGAIRLVGGGRTEQQIKTAERWKKLELGVGFALLFLSACTQAVVMYRSR